MDEESPYQDFVRDGVVLSIAWSDPDPTCTMTRNDISIGAIGGARCYREYGPLVDIVRRGRGAVALTFLTATAPAGQSLPLTDFAGEGQRLVLEEVDVTIAADGSVRSCGTTRFQYAGGMPLFEQPVMCRGWMTGDRRFEPLTSQEDRHLRQMQAVYIRRTPAP